MYLRNMVCFQYIIVNTLRNGNNKDDDDDNSKVLELLTGTKMNCKN